MKLAGCLRHSGWFSFLMAFLAGLSSLAFATSTPDDTLPRFSQVVAQGAATSPSAAVPYDGFPPNDSIPSGWGWGYPGQNSEWFVSMDTAHDTGGTSLRSGPVGNDQQSKVAFSYTFRDGTVSFARKVSSELGFDSLRFYIDDELQEEWSGELDWEVVSYPIEAGPHTLKWQYEKDESESEGSDAAWIDSVLTPLPLMLRSAIYRYDQALNAKGDKTLVGVDCDVFQLVLDATAGQTNLAMGEGNTLEDALAGQAAYPDTILNSDAMFVYALYKDAPYKTFQFNDQGNPGSSAQIGTAKVFGYCYSSKLTSYVYMQEKDLCMNTLFDGTTRSCTEPMWRGGAGTGEYGDMILRDAIYLYGQSLNGKGDKILAGEGCDVMQLVLDVNTGHTDIGLALGDTIDEAIASQVDYADRILDTADMFSYALYQNANIKMFAFKDVENPTSANQIGTATVFGYCYSTDPNARVYLRERDHCTDTFSNGGVEPIEGCVN